MAITVAPYNPANTPFAGVDQSQRIERIYIQVTASGNYPGAPGDTLDLTQLGDLLKSEYVPIFGILQSANAAGASGYEYAFIPGASLSTCKFQVLQTGAINSPSVDIGAVAYPAGVSGDTIIGHIDIIRV